jgi:phosphocarrier protein HPr
MPRRVGKRPVSLCPPPTVYRPLLIMTASKEVVISNIHGLHTRPVMKFVDMASQFTSEIKVHKGGAEPADADGKSVMQMIILAAEAGTPLRIEAEGEDAGEAVRQLVELVESKFGED